MANQAFSKSSLARCLCPIDFYKEPKLRDPAYRDGIIAAALEIAENCLANPITLKTLTLAGKQGYTANDLPSKLILRHCTKNIISSTKIKLKNRTSIARELKIYLKEGTSYRIYRYDIKSFFENISAANLLHNLENNNKLSKHTKILVSAHLHNFNTLFSQGIPRGVEPSPMLAEIALAKFDIAVKAHTEVFYYARFVDDIIILTSSEENQQNFHSWLCQLLPPPLEFNSKKTEIISIPRRNKAGATNPDGKIKANFDFLGYSYTVIDTPLPLDSDGKEKVNTAESIYRKVLIDISTSKLKKLKAKICKSLYNFSKNKDFALLADRINFLASNRDLRHKDTGRRIPTGIYYNYSSINLPSKNLNEIDSFLKKLVTSKHHRLSLRYQSLLNPSQKKQLLKLSFLHGFTNRSHKKFSPRKLKKITRIWL